MASKTAASLFDPITYRGVTMRNRVFVSPMCQYMSTDGFANDYHVAHLGSFAIGGAGLVMMEATGVEARGRITPYCNGIWKDEHIPKLRQVTELITRMGSVPAIQLAHAGRKGSTPAYHQGIMALPAEQAWITVAPSAIPFEETWHTPEALDLAGINQIKAAFRAGARRALTAGFKVLELHGAHGYLLHEFASPLSNKRTDNYGGSFENRTRLLKEIIDEVRDEIGPDVPLFVRISATDWVEGGWTADDSVALARELKAGGKVDLIDCSSGGNVPKADIPVGPGYQVPLAARVQNEGQLSAGAVGMITEAQQANEIITSGKADVVFLARAMLINPNWAAAAAQALGIKFQWPQEFAWIKDHLFKPRA